MSNIELFVNHLQEESIDFAVITDADTIKYFTNYRCETSERLFALLISSKGKKATFFICPEIEIGMLEKNGVKEEYISYRDDQNAYIVLKDKLFIRGAPKRILIQEKSISLDTFDELKKILPLSEFLYGSKIIETYREVKSEEEVAILKEAAKITDEGMKYLEEKIKEGDTEEELLSVLEKYFKDMGIEKMAFPPSIHLKGGTVVNGSLICVDFGIVYKDYCSDITRTLIFGEMSDEQKEIYEIVLNAQMTAIRLVKEGISVADLDKISRKIIENAGYGNYYPHRLGHGIGMSCHETPSLSIMDDTVLKEGMVITIEPGIYLDNGTHVRIEDMVLVGKNRSEVLTNYAK